MEVDLIKIKRIVKTITIKNEIKCEKMNIIHQKEILRILKEEKNIRLNENNNGTFINLTELDSNIIISFEQLPKYMYHLIQILFL